VPATASNDGQKAMGHSARHLTECDLSGNEMHEKREGLDSFRTARKGWV
jgi:hypothetical protein